MERGCGEGMERQDGFKLKEGMFRWDIGRNLEGGEALE